MAYKAPIWEDGKSPAISAENLNNLSQAAEGAQVLYGNSAPTSSTEGAVGQFYLVVVADSDGNYPLYQCVAIANGSYVWRDTRRIPDSITSMLGIPAPGTINSALNVLANVGNLHVWERVQGEVTDYLTSTDRNAYTDGTVGNTTITYLGQLGGGARIEVGSYVGTGTYGKSNPNSLTFGFEPQLVAIFAPSTDGNYAYKLFMLRNVLGASILDSDGNNNGVIVTWSEKSVTWYVYGSKNATYQMNGSGVTYNYIAIG